ncbi:MAG: hypothetical protein Q9168_000864, partial [Polycauliona sp. 1 TL-2023]
MDGVTTDTRALAPQFDEKLQLVLADVKKGTASKAFRAYFKTNANRAYVASIFLHISKGAPVQVSLPGAPSQFTVAKRPILVCIDSTVQFPGVESLQKSCHRVVAAVKPNTQIMIICDGFWSEIGHRPFPPRSDCPKVRYNKFYPDSFRLMYNQFGALIHEFAHLYTGSFRRGEETYEPTAAVKLSPEDSIKNPQNFALYAS